MQGNGSPGNTRNCNLITIFKVNFRLPSCRSQSLILVFRQILVTDKYFIFTGNEEVKQIRYCIQEFLEILF